MSKQHALEQSATVTAHDELLVSSSPIGECVEVLGPAAVAHLLPDTKEVTLGDLLLVEAKASFIIAEVSALRTNDRNNIVTLSLLASINTTSLAITPGVATHPTVRARLFRPTTAVIQAYLEDRRELFEDLAQCVSLQLGTSPLSPRRPLSFSPEKLFGRHCAVVGTSGSGKSWSVARLIEQCAHHKAKVILLDPSGEYETMNHAVTHVHLGAPHRHTSSTHVALPYFDLTETDLISILRPQSAIQLTKLRAAIRSLKLIHLEPRLGVEGNLPKAHRLKTPVEDACNTYREELDRPENTFNISRLPLQLAMECVEPIRSQSEANIWGGVSAAEHTDVAPLINKLEELLASEDLATIFRPEQGISLYDVIATFLRDPDSAVLRLSLEFLPTLNRVREIIANALARHLLSYARLGRFRYQPLLLVVDEAHQTLPKTTSSLSHELPLETFNVIAKEGRKYGLTLCVATQRPRDIPDDVLSQMGTFLVHRLVSDGDRLAIERASGGLKQGLGENLPSLAPGEALLLGIDFPTPLRLQILPPEAQPFSRGPDFQSYWASRSVQ